MQKTLSTFSYILIFSIIIPTKFYLKIKTTTWKNEVMCRAKEQYSYANTRNNLNCRTLQKHHTKTSYKRYDTRHVIEGPGFDSQSAINLFLLVFASRENIYLFNHTKYLIYM